MLELALEMRDRAGGIGVVVDAELETVAMLLPIRQIQAAVR
jgi:hypothetical protein